MLSVHNLSVTLGAVRVLHDIDLTVKPGELLHLVGSNGAGKTTLLRTLCGLNASSGEIKLLGFGPRTVPGRAAFAFVPDEAELYDDLSIAEHAQFAALAYGAPLDDLHAALAAFNLAERFDQFPAELSRGTRQKVGLGIALGLKRPLTLLDEPFGTLDTDSRQVLRDGLSQLAAEGRSAVLTTHGDELTGLRAVRQVSVLQLQGTSR
ncbi:ABC transporter ATP-binding protein [Deinococcus sp.]|uniref:ABC transporter ATP-binding protein n=1 Tax=Deinococcus sp. TaxID=47478 RepID=UPI0025DA21E8|nr:ABC transporter ATP-binding protein [Deinococcus sp.]